MSKNLIDYQLPENAYLNFDAESFKSYMINKLNQNEWFTDQNFIGSNLNNLLDIIAYSSSTLLFYLNQTSKESLFSDAEFYENINRIVKLIGYKPRGFVCPTLGFQASSSLDKGTYSIPRYSFFNINGVAYSFIKDGTFIKESDGEEELTLFSNSNILYGGKYDQLSDYIAVGEENEIIQLSSKNRNIDSNTINVYVKRNNKWIEFTQVEDLYFSKFNDNHFSVRFNEASNYELTFGDGVRGSLLRSGDVVSIFYLNSLGESNEVAQDFLRGDIIVYSTPRINEIISDISQISYVTNNQLTKISFSNLFPSTKSSNKESVENIRNNASIFYQSQNRLISKNDFTSFVKNNYNGIISSVKILNNREFLEKHVAYLSQIGVKYPFQDGRVLTNQYFFSSPCNFNNVYIYAVPRIEQKFSTLNRLNYINPAQKQLIIDSMQNKKEISLDIIIHDPVYMGVDIGVGDGIISKSDIENSKLRISRNGTNVDINNIKTQIFNIIKNYFNPSNFELGQVIDIQNITNQILSIRGVSSISTVNGSRVVNGLNLYIWDVIYDTNYISTSQNYRLDEFQYAFFYNLESLISRIDIQ